jgi:hypothetical protein
VWISKDIYGYLWIRWDAIGYEKINCRISPWIKAGYQLICNGYPFISKEDIHSYPTIYPLISTKDIQEISWCSVQLGYLRMSRDISGWHDIFLARTPR